MSPALSAAAISYVLTIKSIEAASNDHKSQVIDPNAQRNLASPGINLNLSHTQIEQPENAQRFTTHLLAQSA
ncbi:MAG: hypothetical protein KAX95_00910 [Pseudomonas sp.]|nr:hypothetical protein [Pseudomonas sp.]